MGLLRVINGTGDQRVMWDPSRPVEVDQARKTFDEMKEKGYLAYKVDKKGEPGETIKKFDEKAGKIIMAPPMAGG